MDDELSAEEQLLQVVFDLPEESETWPPVLYGRLWAAKTPVKWQLSVRNVPFYCRDVAYGDTILVRADHERQEFVVESLVAKSGHSAVHIIVMIPEFRPELDRQLSGFGALWETANDRYYAVDVLPDTDYAGLRSELIAAQERGSVEIQESALSEQHRDQIPELAGSQVGDRPGDRTRRQ